MTSNQTLVALEGYGRNLTKSVMEQEAPIAWCREAEISQLHRHFESASNKSFVLVGPSGAGKSTIVREFIKQLGARSKKPWVVFETSSSKVLVGAKYIGQWEERLEALIRLAASSERVALFWTDLHHAVGAGTYDGSDNNMAAMMSSVVESGEFVVFGECTEAAYARGIERHPWFSKLLTVFRVDVQDNEVIQQIVRGVATRQAAVLREEKGVDLSWTDEGIAALCHFGRHFFPGHVPPGGAIRLLEQFMIDTAQNRVGSKSRRSLSVRYEHIVPAVESLTGVPTQVFNDAQPLDLQKTRDFFESRIIGQPQAVNAIVDLITLVKAGLADPGKPSGVLFFSGPTGVGKTELAKTLAEFLFGGRDRLVRLDMSEYQDYSAVEKLIGRLEHRPGGTTASSSKLLDRVREHPFSVILLDEIEKANDDVYDLLLQLFDDARLSDAVGRTTDFTQTIVIMTSNLGANAVDGGSFGFSPSAGAPSDELDDAVTAYFRPELINRIDRFVRFQPLEKEHVHVIAKRELGQVLMRSGITRRHLRIDVDPGVLDILATAGFDQNFGARPLKRAVERLVLVPLARELAQTTADQRPALIRLLPAGDHVALKIVHDRQTRKSESIVRGVVVTTESGKKKRVTSKQIRDVIESLTKLLQDIADKCDERGVVRIKSELVKQTSDVSFWDNPDAAREVMTDLYRIEHLLGAVQRLHHALDEAKERFAKAQAGKDQSRLAGVAKQLVSLRQHAEVVLFSLSCPDRLDRCDVFLQISAVEETDADLAGHLVDMYAHWARRKGFTARVVHERLWTKKTTRDAVLLMEGVAQYGLLKHEEGVHEFVYGKTSKAPRSSHFVTVRVLPIVDQPHGNDQEIRVRRKKVTGAGLRCRRYLYEISATDRLNGTHVELHADLRGAEGDRMASDLLNAARQRLTLRSQAHSAAGEPVVRRYTLRPTQSAKDLQTGVVTSHLAELWKGDLDVFLMERLAKPPS